MEEVMKKLVLISLIVILSATVCVGTIFAGGQEEEEPKLITVYMSLLENEWEVIRNDVIPGFTAETGIEVEAVQITAEDALRRADAFVKAGKSGVDLIAVDVMLLESAIDRGIVDSISSSDVNIPDTAIQTLVDIGKKNGTLYFAPYRPNIQLLFYNETVLMENNIKVPETWDEMLLAAKTLSENTGTPKFGMYGRKGEGLSCLLNGYIVSAGGDPLDLDSPECIETFTYLKKLWNYTNPESKGWSTSKQIDPFARGDIVMNIQWPFAINLLVKDRGMSEVKVATVPRGPVDSIATLGGEWLGIVKTSDAKESSKKFMEYMMSKKVQEIFISKLSWPAMRSDCNEVVEPWAIPYYEIISAQMEKSASRPAVPYWSEVSAILQQTFWDIVIDNGPVEENLIKSNAEIETIIKANS
jgi:trehalose transport system substrate-binding protein